MPAETKAALSMYELTQRSEFASLTVRQSVWVLVYVQHFLDTEICDPVAATLAAYECKSEEIARTLSYQIQSSKSMRAVLARFFGEDVEEVQHDGERAKVLRKVRKHLAAAEPGSVAAQRLVAQEERLVLGGKVSAPEEEDATVPAVTAQRFSVGDICVQNGQRFRVTSVDPNGTPLTAEPTL